MNSVQRTMVSALGTDTPRPAIATPTLATLIGAYRDLQLVAEAANGREAIERYRQHQPDVTLMDLSMPTMGGVGAISTVRAEFPDARIIALTTWDGDVVLKSFLRAGSHTVTMATKLELSARLFPSRRLGSHNKMTL